MTSQAEPPASVPNPPALEAISLTKRFGHVTALNQVSLHAREGEILAIVGDNGAGKSTLVKIITGVVQPDSGELRVFGRHETFATASDARRSGISSVFQDLALVESLDVATNMFLGQLPRRGWFVDRRKMEQESKRVLDELNVGVRSVRTPIGMLSGGQRQIVALARAIRSGARIVLLDEPTAALGVRETGRAKEIIQALRERGNAVIIVSHDLELVFEISDRIEVLRLGRVAGQRRTAESSRDEIVGLITGSIHDEEVA